MGYHRAGFDVVGVDINPQPNYPFDFWQGDALTVLHGFADGWRSWNGYHPIDAIHASPPCQAYAFAGTSRKRLDHPDLLGPTRDLLDLTGVPWVIENIPGAPMNGPIVLCGAIFDLPIVRHRLFETSWPIWMSHGCGARSTLRATDHGPSFAPYARGSWEARWREEVLPVVWPWMTLAEAGQAIPPAYTEFIGRQLMQHLSSEAVAPAQ